MKKQTKQAKFNEYKKRYPNATPAEIAKVLGMSTQQVYNLNHRWKRTVGVSKPTITNETEIKSQGAVIAVQKRTIESLQDEIGAWRNSYQNAQQQRITLEKELTDVKIAYLDLTAVVRYLERKIADLTKGE